MAGDGISLFQHVTLLGTLALMVFVLWISDGVMIGRWIAGGVLLFGALQWLFLRRLGQKLDALSVSDLDQSEGNR